LLKVHKKLLDEGYQHQIKIIGDGYDFENIKNLKTELGLDKTAEMLGFTENPYPYLKSRFLHFEFQIRRISYGFI
jgi:glycosyltransferase involved in cell wall biosynthesis